MWMVPVAVCCVIAVASLLWGYDAVDAWIRHNQAATSLWLAVAFLIAYIAELEDRVDRLEAKAKERPPT